MFTFSHVVYFFAHELAGLRRGRLALAFGPRGALPHFFLGHEDTQL